MAMPRPRPARRNGARAVTVRVKICCIASPGEAYRAARAGAHAIGLVSAMPSGPGVIDEGVIARIAAGAPAGMETFLLTALTDAEAIAAQHGRCGTGTIQLVDEVAGAERRRLRRSLPGVKLVQVVHVRDAGAVEAARAAAEGSDALLLDSGNPGAALRTLGGTGDTHDWDVSARIVAEAPVPVYLAGGLRAENVGEAIRRVRPYGVDVCSGVRSGDALDDARLTAFVAATEADDA